LVVRYLLLKVRNLNLDLGLSVVQQGLDIFVFRDHDARRQALVHVLDRRACHLFRLLGLLLGSTPLSNLREAELQQVLDRGIRNDDLGSPRGFQFYKHFSSQQGSTSAVWRRLPSDRKGDTVFPQEIMRLPDRTAVMADQRRKSGMVD